MNLTNYTQVPHYCISKPDSDFKIFNENRCLDKDHVKSCMQAFINNEYIPPIIVTEDGIILDGQHRYKAFEFLYNQGIKKNLEFIVVSNLYNPIEVAIKLNSTAKPWQTKDYLRAYCIQNVPAYKFILDLIIECPKLEIMAAYQMIKLSYSSSVFRSGKLEISVCEKRQAYSRLESLYKVSEILQSDLVFKRGIISAYCKVHNEIKDFSKFLENLKTKFIMPITQKSSDWYVSFKNCL